MLDTQLFFRRPAQGSFGDGLAVSAGMVHVGRLFEFICNRAPGIRPWLHHVSTRVCDTPHFWAAARDVIRPENSGVMAVMDRIAVSE